MAKTSKSCWTGFERRVAAQDWASKRNPLSGANSRQDDGSPRGGDVIIPQGLDVLVECKLRASFAHHTLFADAVADAVKHKKRHAILYTKKKHDHGWLVTVDGGLWNKLLQIEGVMDALKVPSGE
jgi:hypothetical protein